MTPTDVSRAEALRRITTDGVESVLLSAGFVPARKLAWVRQESELQHVIALLSRRHMYDVQWGVVSPDAVRLLWGHDSEADGDVGVAVMSGTPGTIRHPPGCQSFRLEDPVSIDSVNQIVSGLSSDLRVVEERLRAFRTRRELRTYLLVNRDVKDRRDFIIPSNLPLKLFTAAALAVLDADPGCCELALAAEREMAQYRDTLSKSRLQRLRAAAAELCDATR